MLCPKPTLPARRCPMSGTTSSRNPTLPLLTTWSRDAFRTRPRYGAAYDGVQSKKIIHWQQEDPSPVLGRLFRERWVRAVLTNSPRLEL